MQKQVLKSLIVRYDGSQEKLAAAMGISLSRLNAKINEKSASFNATEMDFIRKRYHLTDDEFVDLFFAHSVS